MNQVLSTFVAMMIGSSGLPHGAVTAKAAGQKPEVASKKESPLACDRLALTAEQRHRHFEEVGPELRAKRKSVRALADGYEFEFPGDSDTFQLAAEWARVEHICCPFFEISLRLEPEGGALLVRVTGREGVKQFMEADGAEWVKQ